MRNDPEAFHSPVEQQPRRPHGRRKRPTFVILVSLFAAIGGLWIGWQARRGGSLHAKGIASIASPFGNLPREKPVDAPSKIEAGLANELAKRAVGTQTQEQSSSGVIIADAQASETRATALDAAKPAPPAADPARPSVPQQLASLGTAPQYNAITAPPVSAPPPAEAAEPEPAASEPTVQAPPPPEIPADEQQEMLARVTTMLRQGDIAGARTMLMRLDRVGNGQASFELAQTYDPVMLNRWNVFGIAPDPNKAMHFYQRALDEGVPEAQQHLTASTSGLH